MTARSTRFRTIGWLALLALGASVARGAPDYAVATTSFTFADASGISMTAIVHHPATRHNGTAIPAAERFPAVLFLQGANVDAARYSWLRALAAGGYIVVLPDKYPTPGPRFNGQPGINPNTKLTNVSVFDAAAKRLKSWAEESGSPIRGRFDGRIVLAGHSMGAYAAIIALDESRCLLEPVALCPLGYQRDPTLAAMWLIGGHREGNGDPDPGGMLLKPAGFPIYLIAGERDRISTTEEVQSTFRRYDYPKLYWAIDGANHFGWTDYLSSEDNLQEEIAATITPAEQQQRTVAGVRDFLDCKVKGVESRCARIPTSIVP